MIPRVVTLHDPKMGRSSKITLGMLNDLFEPIDL